jgi:hypothetical protein
VYKPSDTVRKRPRSKARRKKKHAKKYTLYYLLYFFGVGLCGHALPDGVF